MKSIQHAILKNICMEILLKLGIEASIAHEVAECLIQASLRGIDTHGIRLLPHYVDVVKSGRINRSPKIKFEKTAPTSGVLDADHTFGHAAGTIGMKYAIEMAGEVGAGFVAIKNSTHFSIAGYYSLQAARNDMIGISATNTTSAMVPTRGKKPYFGTNALSFAFPVEGEDPICLDMATTQVAWNRVLRASDNGVKLEDKWAIDENGMPTDDPKEAKGLLPAGLYKGYGLAFLVEVLCGVLTGQPFGPHLTPMFTDLEKKRYLSHFVGAIKISNFIEINTFKKNVKKMALELRNSLCIEESKPVLVAGDPEKISIEDRTKNGIPVDDFVVAKLNEIISELGLSKRLVL